MKAGVTLGISIIILGFIIRLVSQSLFGWSLGPYQPHEFAWEFGAGLVIFFGTLTLFYSLPRS